MNMVLKFACSVLDSAQLIIFSHKFVLWMFKYFIVLLYLQLGLQGIFQQTNIFSIFQFLREEKVCFQYIMNE